MISQIEWIKVEDRLPEKNTKVIAIFDMYYPHPHYPESQLPIWNGTRQFIAYINSNNEWYIDAPIIRYEAEKYGMKPLYWIPEISFPKEIIERNEKYYKKSDLKE
jgi:hypothetical protein